MAGMLDQLGLELWGHHHLGIHDARNIARVAIELANRAGVGTLQPTAQADPKAKPIYRRRRTGIGAGASTEASTNISNTNTSARISTSACVRIHIITNISTNTSIMINCPMTMYSYFY